MAGDLKEYNGFSGDFRKSQGDRMRRARNQGKLADWSKMPCEICQCTVGLIMGHLENYYAIEYFNALCVECHMKLHARFKNFNGWIAHLIDVRDGYMSVGFLSVMTYFPSKQAKDFFAISENFPTFVSNQNLWYELLLPYKVDLKKQIDDGKQASGMDTIEGLTSHGHQPTLYTG